MKRRNLFIVLAATLGCMSMMSCQDDDTGENTANAEKASFALSLQMPVDRKDPKLLEATATLVNVATKETFTTDNFTKNGDEYIDT
ncbi:MAG: hypothetical protein LUC45_02330 [Paraprevotella sp.]|nr:hypothetical protein [Paraprevotella sp.]